MCTKTLRPSCLLSSAVVGMVTQIMVILDSHASSSLSARDIRTEANGTERERTMEGAWEAPLKSMQTEEKSELLRAAGPSVHYRSKVHCARFIVHWCCWMVRLVQTPIRFCS